MSDTLTALQPPLRDCVSPVPLSLHVSRVLLLQLLADRRIRTVVGLEWPNVVGSIYLSSFAQDFFAAYKVRINT